MSDTNDAPVRRPREDSPTVDAVCRQLERQVPPELAKVAVDFTELLLSKAPTDFLNQRSSDALARMAFGAFQFLQRSDPNRVDVEVFNPDVDNEGWYGPVTVLRTNISERPFVVDTLREFLHSQDAAIEHIVYPVIHVERDEEGQVVRVRPSQDGETRESLIHCEIARVTDPEHLDFLRNETVRRLQDVVRATDDFHPMVDAVNNRVAELAERLRDLPERKEEIEEIQSFLRWLRDGAFVFLGYRAYDLAVLENGERAIVVEPGSGLGILRNEAESSFAEPVPVSSLDPWLRDLVEGGPMLIISKTNAASTVHRLARMDYIGIKKLTPEGEVAGEHRFIGLFTSKAYSEQADHIPILRLKLQQILQSAGVGEGSHDYKEINTIFNSMPGEELFLTSVEEIGADIQTILTAYNTEEIRVTLREDPLHRGVSTMVILPKEKFSGDVRKRIEEALVARLKGEVLNYRLAMGEGDQARLHFFLAASPGVLPDIDVGELEAMVRELIRTWTDRVRAGLEKVRPPDEARRLARRYSDGFSPEYQAAMDPDTAVQDILQLEAMQADERMESIAFTAPEEDVGSSDGEQVTRLKLYLRGERLILSDFMPILENAGLRVIAVNPWELRGSGTPEAIIYSFAVQDSAAQPLEVDDHGSLLAEALLAVRGGDATNNRFNALVLLAGLSWREVEVLRAYSSYAFQLGAVPSRQSLPSALIGHPNIARVLFDIFEAKFDPEGPVKLEERRKAVEDLEEFLSHLLSGVKLLADDRALRRLATLLGATVRTNYYRNGGRSPTRTSGGVPFTSFKFQCKAFRDIAKTRLMYEVWVRSSRMEGLHLRGAKVARGGIRHSDRPDDFRTEILGLVNTQMVKNSVIVPAGSKGGFVTLRALGSREEMAEEAKAQYQTLMRGLLDLTDNIEDGGTVPPQDVVCWDDPDPYLVVAADKGTAKFSDVANDVAAEYGFWLGDAFASGGSQGYDHKVVGITARGAWECVKRHFREIGKEIQSEPFTVVGIGDMSGDVFGNGMLLSPHTRLIAAFDHRHVFIDPDPDPKTSFKERKRLFEMGPSSWEDYDASLLSEGGVILPREAKEVNLSPQARTALGVPDDVFALDGESLIRVLLRAPVELLWNGGIGTYVKASSESQADAGDPPNDAVRVDESELRCSVVGEGGNLGFTQRARIEFALRGGKINTDALDNSGGVDLSDREVNLKILLNPAVATGTMTQDERNDLLEELTEAVATLVLRDNESQGLAISLDEARASEGLEDSRDLMSALERAGEFERAAEDLPTWEVLYDRHVSQGKGLSRPELCVLLAHSKLNLMGHLLKSRLPDDDATESYLRGYFPPAATKEAGEKPLAGHRLRREIISSQLTNDLVDLMGATFVNRLARDTGRTPAEVARAWLVGARLAGHRALVRQLSSVEGEFPTAVAYRWLLGLSRVLERTTRWVLTNVGPDRETAAIINENLEQLVALREDFADVVAGEDRKLFRARVREIEKLGAEPHFARDLITLRFLDQLLEILRVASETGAEPLVAGKAYYRMSALLSLPWLRNALSEAARENRWDQRAAQALIDDLNRAHHELATQAVRWDSGLDGSGNGALLSPRSRKMVRFTALLDDIRDDDPVSLSGLSVAVREVTLLARWANGDQP